MSVLSALVAELDGNSGVAALVATRTYTMQAPQGAAFPYIIVQTISGDHKHHLGAATGRNIARVQVDCFGTTYASARAVADAVRSALDGFQGTLGSGSDTLNCRMLHLDSDRDETDPPTDGSQSTIRRVVLDFLIGHAESIPTFA